MRWHYGSFGRDGNHGTGKVKVIYLHKMDIWTDGYLNGVYLEMFKWGACCKAVGFMTLYLEFMVDIKQN